MNFINELINKAVNVYNVNPYIFVGLFFASLPFYYPGYYLMIKAGYRYFKNDYKKSKDFDLGNLIKSKGFLPGLIINRFGWVLPYLYLMTFGRNLPIWIYMLIIMWLGLTTYLTIFKTRTKIITDAIMYKIVDKNNEIQARRFLSKRYGEVEFITESESKLPYEDEYVKYSRYFVAERGGEIIGVIRVVGNSEVGLPVLNDSKIYKKDMDGLKKAGLDKIAEIGNLAAIPGQNIAKGLYKIVIKYCLKNKLVTVARIDDGLLRSLLKKYPILRPFVHQIGENVPYPGSICVPIRIKFFSFMLLFI